MSAASGILDPALVSPPLGWRPADPRWRRLVAARVVWRLAEGAAGMGGFASAEVHVRFARTRGLKPLVAVFGGEPPRHGIVRSPPLLVVALAGSEVPPRWWVSRGVQAVWVLDGDGGGACHAAGGEVTVVRAARTFQHPDHPGLSLSLARLVR